MEVCFVLLVEELSEVEVDIDKCRRLLVFVDEDASDDDDDGR